jgi:hypothetical protein
MNNDQVNLVTESGYHIQFNPDSVEISEDGEVVLDIVVYKNDVPVNDYDKDEVDGAISRFITDVFKQAMEIDEHE